MPTAYSTAPPDAATDIARELVEDRLAACVNTVDCHSVYRWDGEIQAEDEVILLAKTTDSRFKDLHERVLQTHPYDTPCIERFDETELDDAFGQWIRDETRQ
jgi:periplasmic divalent cation tolerance protein